jgi:hypothetical protein
MQARYRVIPGQQVAHHGKVYLGGEVLELDTAIALEVRSLITPVDAAGKPKPWPTDAATTLAAELAKARPHEELRLQGETPKGK